MVGGGCLRASVNQQPLNAMTTRIIMPDQTPTENTLEFKPFTLDVEGLLTKLRTAHFRKVANIATTPSVI